MEATQNNGQEALQSKGTSLSEPNRKKDSFYFPHDCTARNDPKIINLRMKLGMEGYGIYFAILEILRGESGYRCAKIYDSIAFDLRATPEIIRSVIEDYELFSFDEDYFYSPGLNRRMIPLDNLRQQRSSAGKKSSKKRWDNGNSVTTVTDSVTTVTENCNNKIKEDKVNISDDNEEMKEEKKSLSSSEISNSIPKGIDVLKRKCECDPDFLKYINRETKIISQSIPGRLTDFNEYLKFKKIFAKSENDYKDHFLNWLRKKLASKDNNKPKYTLRQI